MFTDLKNEFLAIAFDLTFLQWATFLLTSHILKMLLSTSTFNIIL